jgi:hypothetical protein
MNRLLLGAGEWSNWSDWVTVDADPAYKPDVVAMLPPFPPELSEPTWGEIMAVHFIEHLHVWDALRLLRDCFDLLSPGGVLILEQPDISYCARVLLGQVEPPPGSEPGQFDLWGFYGSPVGQNPLYGHHWGYTPDSLTALLLEAGFKSEHIAIKPAVYHVPMRDFRLEAIKS